MKKKKLKKTKKLSKTSLSGHKTKISSKKRQRKNLHDLLFKSVYSQSAFCTDIFKLALTAQQFCLFDWSTLSFEINAFVDPEWREKRSDLLCSVKTKDRKSKARIIFLLEAKSGYEEQWMTQLLHYQTGIYNKSKDPVVTVLFYTGRKKKWSGPPELSRTFKLSKELKKAFFKGCVEFSGSSGECEGAWIQGIKRQGLAFRCDYVYNG